MTLFVVEVLSSKWLFGTIFNGRIPLMREEGEEEEEGRGAHNWGEVALLVPGCVGM